MEGLTLFSKVGGFSGSSSRTELSAAIISIAANGPIHLASDSESFVKRANALINKIAKCKDHKIKWKMHNDGDLWEQFHDALISKGPLAVTIVWTKGHAKQEHIDKGLTNNRNKAGNDKADNNAEQGHCLHHKTLRDACTWLSRRHNDYTKFMKNVVTHIIEAYIIHRQLQENNMTDKGELNGKIHYKSLVYPKSTQCGVIPQTVHLGHYGAFVKKTSVHNMSMVFLKT